MVGHGRTWRARVVETNSSWLLLVTEQCVKCVSIVIGLWSK